MCLQFDTRNDGALLPVGTGTYVTAIWYITFTFVSTILTFKNGERTTGVSFRGMEICNLFTYSNNGIDLLQQSRKSKKVRRLLAIREISSESIHRMEGTD